MKLRLAGRHGVLHSSIGKLWQPEKCRFAFATAKGRQRPLLSGCPEAHISLRCGARTMSARPPPVSSYPPGGSRSQRPASVLAAASFCVLGSDPQAIGGALEEVRAAVPMPTAALIFAAGPLAEMGDKTLSALRAELGDIPIVLGSSTGVLTERAEQEGAS